MLFKYADDSTIIAPVWKEQDYSDQLVSQFLDWMSINGMSCNPNKCKEPTLKKRGNCDLFSPIGLIPICKEVEILGVTFQCDSKFSEHVKNKLVKANKSLQILRGCLHDTGTSFILVRVHPGSYLSLCFCLHDTGEKSHTSTTHTGMSSSR